jgi:hypothetical protein
MNFACKISLPKSDLARPSRKTEDNAEMAFDKNGVILRYFITVVFLNNQIFFYFRCRTAG